LKHLNQSSIQFDLRSHCAKGNKFLYFALLILLVYNTHPACHSVDSKSNLVGIL